MVMWLKACRTIGGIVLLLLFISSSNPVYGQLTLDFEVDETLANSQAINIQSLLTNNLQGPPLFNIYLKNQSSSEYLSDLYLKIVFKSEKAGGILEITQPTGRPFSLKPNQQAYLTNNNFGNSLPGIEGPIVFERDFIQDGRDFYNKLEGATYLPPDRYKIMVEVHRGSPSGELLASQTDEVGANIAEDTRDFYLLSPGDELGSGTVISNPYPNFQWQGGSGGTYRLIVVESRNNESPQSLMEGAFSTEPIESTGSNGGGSLVDYEMLDVVVNGSGYQYPNSGVQDLQEDTQYYWRIINQITTSSGEQERESEIWSFTLADMRSASNSSQAGETARALEQILGDRFEEIRQNDFSFESIEVEGQTFRSVQAMQKLMELARKNNQGDVSIIIEN